MWEGGTGSDLRTRTHIVSSFQVPWKAHLLNKCFYSHQTCMDIWEDMPKSLLDFGYLDLILLKVCYNLLTLTLCCKVSKAVRTSIFPKRNMERERGREAGREGEREFWTRFRTDRRMARERERERVFVVFTPKNGLWVFSGVQWKISWQGIPRC